MKHKIFIILILLLLAVGCNKQEKTQATKEIKKDEVKEQKVEEPKYQDLNKTPIAFYNGKTILKEYKTNIKTGTDIGVFSIYLSNEDNIEYSNYATSFYDKYIQYKNTYNIKIGYNLKYTVKDGTTISHNILSVKDTHAYEGYILLFLYDDYNNRNKEFYSYIEENEENENTVVSSIKLYPQSASPDITSKITLTVFTYDSEDDFDENKEYRGNSKYSIEICDFNKTC